MADLRSKLLRLGVFLLPVILVKGMGSILGAPGPEDTAAATIDPIIAEVARARPRDPSWTPAQLAAAERIRALRIEPFGTTPLFYERTEDPVDPTPTHDPVEHLDVRLQAILASPTHATALINNRPYRAGDRIANTGWRIAAIDSSARTVQLQHDSTGRTRTLKVDRD